MILTIEIAPHIFAHGLAKHLDLEENQRTFVSCCTFDGYIDVDFNIPALAKCIQEYCLKASEPINLP